MKRSKSELRGTQILRLLQHSGSVSVDELCSQLDVSIATVRRDLSDLEEQGLLRRTHGGATPVEPLLYETLRSDSSFREQMEKHATEKRRIGLAAGDLIEDGDIICLTPGTTTTEVVRSIHDRRNVTVITNTVNVAMEISQRSDLNVIVTGGALRTHWFSLVGSLTVDALSQMFPNKLFIGASGVHAQRGLTCHCADEAAVNRMMVQNAKMRIAVADHSKLGVIAAHRICGFDTVDVLITDTGATDEMIEPFLDIGIEMRRV